MSPERTDHVEVRIHGEKHVIAARLQKAFNSTTEATSKEHNTGDAAGGNGRATREGKVAVGPKEMRRRLRSRRGKTR